MDQCVIPLFSSRDLVHTSFILKYCESVKTEFSNSMEKSAQEYAPIYADDSSSRQSISTFDDVDLTQLHRRSTWQRIRGWVLHLVLIAIYTTVFLLSTRRGWKAENIFELVDSKIYYDKMTCTITKSRLAPAKSVGAETHLDVFDIMGKPHGIYTGEPRPETDKAWKDLLQSSRILPSAKSSANVCRLQHQNSR